MSGHSSTLVPVLLHKCRPPRWLPWRRWPAGTRWTCECSVTFYRVGGLDGFWLPDGPLNRAKRHAVEGGDGFLFLADGFLLSKGERRDVDEYKRRHLAWVPK